MSHLGHRYLHIGNLCCIVDGPIVSHIFVQIKEILFIQHLVWYRVLNQFLAQLSTSVVCECVVDQLKDEGDLKGKKIDGIKMCVCVGGWMGQQKNWDVADKWCLKIIGIIISIKFIQYVKIKKAAFE